uniref:cyclin-D3-1-like n=1 Tax=Erigeron canadensis TaxID=72917 RepID=UPI001CB96C71|nr:cyclin-D3-1-like [Erigeron canadensis]
MMTTLLDSLYCEEKHYWEEENEQQQQVDSYTTCLENEDDENDTNSSCINNCNISHQDLFWEDDELSSLISKEQLNDGSTGDKNRREMVEWVMEVASHYSFATLTVVLAVNYLDRFLEKFDSKKFQQQPWITQLTCVSCLSLAAKVEETHVPLLLDLQMDGSKYVFEGKTIQKMEMLILSTLEWKMNPVTPLSFLDFITRRLGLSPFLSLQFLKRCESLLLCLLPEERFRCYLPSVVATATMMHVINNLEPCIGIRYKSQLLGILGINKEEVEDCWKEIQEITCGRNSGRVFNKRKFGLVPGSPDAVMDMSFSSDESWSVVNPSGPSSSELGVKKARKGAAA